MSTGVKEDSLWQLIKFLNCFQIVMRCTLTTTNMLLDLGISSEIVIYPFG